MAYCRQEGKDQIIFVTREDHESPSNAELVVDDPNDPYEEYGLTLPSGEINWNCPCLEGMASGPCGESFKSAFACFHYSTDEIKGSDCIEQFQAMQECVQNYPDVYPQEENEAEGEDKDEDKSDFYEEGKEDEEGREGEDGEEGEEDKEESEEEEEEEEDYYDSYYAEGEEDDVYYEGAEEWAEEWENDYYEEGGFYYEEEEDENIYYEIDYYGEDEEEEDRDVYYELDYYGVEEEEEEEEPAKSVEEAVGTEASAATKQEPSA